MTVGSSLAAVLDGWMVGAEPGERSPYARLTLTDPSGAVLTSHELTYRQATELSALISDAPPDAAPGRLAAELGHFAGPADPPVVQLTVDGPGPPVRVEFDARAAGHLHELLEYGLAQRVTARRLIETRSPLRAGQRVRLRAGSRHGTVAYLTVVWPHDPGGQAILWCHVHLDTADSDRPAAFPVSALAPLP